MASNDQPVSGAHVVVVGAGGNIGSHLIPHLARMPRIARVTIVDRDTYEHSNLAGQDITPHDIGRPKTLVQARRLRRLNPALEVIPRTGPVEDMPLGALRCDVLLACLDSRASRRYVNQAAWRLGVPWIDTGVEGSGLLARVNVYVPGVESPCLECAWDERDYDALEQRYPCGANREAPATNAPSSLGALAASLLAIECHKWLGGASVARVAAGCQVLIDAAHHRHYVTEFRRNPRCRLADHQPWDIEVIRDTPADVRLAEAMRLDGRCGSCQPAAVSVAGRVLALREVCVGCGRSKTLHRFVSATIGSTSSCPSCGGQGIVPGADTIEWLDPDDVPARWLEWRLARLGVRAQDVLTIRDSAGRKHFEMGSDDA